MILDRIKEIKEDLELFDSDLDKYEYIVDLGKKLPPLEKYLYEDGFIVKGCTSKVWLVPRYRDGKIYFSADSNSVIVKGLITILVNIFNELSPKDIVDFDIKELEVLNLQEIISPTRQNGLYHMINKIRHYGELYKEEL